MSNIDLHDQFERWAAPLRTAPAPALPELRRRTRRRTARIAATAVSAVATCAVVVLIAVALAATPRVAGPHPRPSSIPAGGLRAIFGTGTYPAPRAAPYEMVYGRGADSARVLDAATGRTAFTARPAGGRTSIFTTIAAAPGDRIFVLAEQSTQNRTSFDILRLRAGRWQLSPVMPGVSLPPGNQIYGMTVNPRGTRLALNTIDADGVGPLHLYVYDLSTGALLDDFSESAGTVDLQYWPSADKLAFSWDTPAGRDGHSAGSDVLRVLDTARAAAGHTSASMIAGSTADPAVFQYNADVFSTDGTVAIDVRSDGPTVYVREFATASGRLLHAFAIGTTQARNQSANYCGVLWASADGAGLLTQCGDVQQEVANGRAVRTRLAVAVPASQVGWANTFAW
jgi:hypothetical protein